jgi:hypothetical protein
MVTQLDLRKKRGFKKSSLRALYDFVEEPKELYQNCNAST